MTTLNEVSGFVLDRPLSDGSRFQKAKFQLKPFGDYDIDIRIESCSICGTDLHIATGEWKEQPWPLCIGHEITGVAVTCGKKVTLINPGQRVGVGAQAYSCGTCKQCTDGNKTYCQVSMVHTVGSIWPDSGVTQQGGMASHIRVDENWVFPIPDGLESKFAAPMLCGGITAYAPLVSYGDIKGKKVGIIGLGGIGHFAVLWAKALGAETFVISRTRAKEQDARDLGADGYITTDMEDWSSPHRASFSLILNTANSVKGFDLSKYLSMIDVRGHFICVGLPSDGFLHLNGFDMIQNGVLIGYSHLGSREQILDMFQLAVENQIKPWIEEVPLSGEGLLDAIDKIEKNKARYKITFTGFEKAFDDFM